MALASGGLRPGRFFVILMGSKLRGKTAEDRGLLELLDPVADAAGYEIVRLRLMGGEHARRLQIMAETPDGQMVVEDCARLSRAIAEVMDAADPIEGEYTLEVSSPGVDRPLTRPKDFVTYEGHEARLELDRVADGRKRFRGMLAGLDGDNVAMDLEGEAETALVPWFWIASSIASMTISLSIDFSRATASAICRSSSRLAEIPVKLMGFNLLDFRKCQGKDRQRSARRVRQRLFASACRSRSVWLR